MKILCVAKNYAKHAQEMGGQTPDTPVWFLKPETSIIHDGDAIRLPRKVGAIHHEVEQAVRIGPDGRPDAMSVAIDVTARDLQSQAKAQGRPWTMAKGFDTFLPLGSWVPFEEDVELRLEVNGELRQSARTSEMTWSVEALLRHAAFWTTLQEGDILLTGTPEGVGPIEPGDDVRCQITGHVQMRNPVVEA